ncbi:MAG: FtsX-like permease family protein [Clostridia bacterium]|nr:FtsX-like permease family protein [Clostridia bacterium]
MTGLKRDRFFFLRLAAVNLRKNGQTYTPFLLTCTGCFCVVFTMLTIAFDPGIQDLPGGASLRSMLAFGVWILGIFSAVFILYTNSFLMKRRKKEFALYAILGLERRHVARVLLLEAVYSYLLTAGSGLLLGGLTGKLVFLVLLRIVRVPTPLTYSPSPQWAVVAATAFAGIFTLVLLSNLVRIRRASPVALLQGERSGEREPRASWILTLVGLAALGAAYWFALTVETPLSALAYFFLAVLLVIAGTFALFTSGSIKLLKILRRNRRFYYRPGNFISVSGMMYRMKQNAAGLASICILSTMVLVTLSTTVALYAGAKENLAGLYPRDMTLNWEASQGTREDLLADIHDMAVRHGVEIRDETRFDQLSMRVTRQGDSFVRDDGASMGIDDIQLHLITLEEYNRITGSAARLETGEILIHSNRKPYGADTVRTGAAGPLYTVRQELEEYTLEQKRPDTAQQVYTIVTAGEDALADFASGVGRSDGSDPMAGMRHYVLFDISGTSDDEKAFAEEAGAAVWETLDTAVVESRQLTESNWFCTFGGFLFIGIYIGGMFLMATVLIIYYKQVSEGYQDRTRFEIMQKVGMDRREVRRTIRRQILLVFFLPLAGAVVHLGFSFGFLPKMLALFGLYDIPLFLLCAALTLLVFALIYLAVFAVTARTYDRLVRFGSETP